MDQLHVFLKLGRARMTVFSAVTYSASATIFLQLHGGSLHVSQFLFGYFFVLFTQFMTHFVGELYDLKADRLHYGKGPWTGGSKMLVQGLASQTQCLAYAVISGAASMLILLTSVTNSIAVSVGLAMWVGALLYAPLNHMAWGEADAVLVTNIMLPFFAAAVQLGGQAMSVSAFIQFLLRQHRWGMLVLPPAFAKFSLFLVLNINDLPSDWLASKITMPVALGDQAARRRTALSLLLAYISAVTIALVFPLILPTRNTFFGNISTLAWIFLSAPQAAKVIHLLLHDTSALSGDRLCPAILWHSPLMIAALFLEAIVIEAANTSIPQVLLSPHFHLQCLPLYAWIATMVMGMRASRAAANSQTSQAASSAAEQDLNLKAMSASPVLILGAGVGGLALAAALKQLSVPYIVLEKRGVADAVFGADVALWPSAKILLRLLGVSDDWWSAHAMGIRRVNLVKTDAAGALGRMIQSFDMAAVTADTREEFQLLSRGDLMQAMQALVPAESIRYGVTVTGLRTLPSGLHEATLGDGSVIEARFVVGADGINSYVRRTMLLCGVPEARPSYSGEVAVRGVVDLGAPDVKPHLERILGSPGFSKDGSMNILYHPQGRYSFGKMSREGSVGYWWIKVPAADPRDVSLNTAAWPEALQLLLSVTRKEDRYDEPVLDRTPLALWSGPGFTLLGDAAHPVTSNLGQGACMAIEDAVCLAGFLKQHWGDRSQAGGLVEACYGYERSRVKHVAKVAKDARFQNWLSQFKHPVATAVREWALGAVPKQAFAKKLRDTNIYDIIPDMKRFQTGLAAAK